jgi:hypothetical protein
MLKPKKKIELSAEAYRTFTRLPEYVHLTAYGMQRDEKVLKSLVSMKLATMTRCGSELAFLKAKNITSEIVEHKTFIEDQKKEVEEVKCPAPATRTPAVKKTLKKTQVVKPPKPLTFAERAAARAKK